jgi:hypothetical protein
VIKMRTTPARYDPQRMIPEGRQEWPS